MSMFRRRGGAAGETWKAEVLARLKEPRCWVCAHLVNEVRRDFFWFASEQYYESRVVDKMRMAYGFCPTHTRYFLQTGGHSVNVTVFHYVTWYVITRLGAARDLLTQAGSKPEPRQLCRRTAAALRPQACPMCQSLRQGEEINLSALLHALALGEVKNAYASSAGLCVPHFRQAGQRAEWDTLAFLTTDLQRRLRGKTVSGKSTRGLLEQAVGLDRDRSIRKGGVPERAEKQHLSQTFIEHGNPARSRSPTFEQMVVSLAAPGCPVCRACAEGIRQYLGWLAREMEAQALVSGTWDLSWHVCPSHLWELYSAGHDRPAALIAEHMTQEWLWTLDGLAAGLSRRPSKWWLQRLQQGFLAWCGVYDPDASLDSPRARSRWSKAATVLESPQHKLGDLRTVAFRADHCQACEHIQTTTHRNLDLILRMLEDPNGRKAYHEGSGLCLRHCIEATKLAEVPAALAELLSAQIARLRILEWELEEAMRKESWSVRYERKDAENNIWHRAAYQLCGLS